jgi:hypothetical protein
VTRLCIYQDTTHDMNDINEFTLFPTPSHVHAKRNERHMTICDNRNTFIDAMANALFLPNAGYNHAIMLLMIERSCPKSKSIIHKACIKLMNRCRLNSSHHRT